MKDFPYGVVLFISLVVGFFVYIVLQEHFCMERAEYKKIIDIGACDRYGKCGVMFEDGTLGRIYLPIKGSKVMDCGLAR